MVRHTASGYANDFRLLRGYLLLRTIDGICGYVCVESERPGPDYIAVGLPIQK